MNSDEFLLRRRAPAIVVIVEVEAPTRLHVLAGGAGDDERLADWLAARADRFAVVEHAAADASDVARAGAWSRQLAVEQPRGVAWLAESLSRAHRRIADLEAQLAEASVRVPR